MGGIAGVFNRDGRPADSAQIERMTRAAAERGPDGVHHWLAGAVALAHLRLHTTPQSLQERQPLEDRARGLCLSFEGRVDNRDELREQLAPQHPLRDDSDAELVLRAYQRWQLEWPQHVLGDFAAAVWDAGQQRLMCARDILGVVPLYYCEVGDSFRFGSALPQLLSEPDVPRDPDERAVAEHLAFAFGSEERTLFRAIRRLPPAHLLLVTRRGVETRRYWSPDPGRELRVREAEYPEQFRELLERAVRCRLRSHGRVGAYLSGGLDSSSVVATVQSLARDGSCWVPGFETFSVVFPDRACDETEFIDAVTRMWGLTSNRIGPDADGGRCYREGYEAQVRRTRDLPNFPSGRTADSLKRLARERGFRVLLTGLGGDEWLAGSPLGYADRLGRLQLWGALRQAWLDAGVEGQGDWASRLLHYGVWPLLAERLPEGWRRGIRRLLRSGRPRPYPWLPAEFLQRVGFSEPERPAGYCPWRSRAAKDVFDWATNGRQVHVWELEERNTAGWGLEQRHPLADRRIIEFALALPERQRSGPGEPKWVLRQAMRGLLPELVRRRKTKASFSHAFAEALASRADLPGAGAPGLARRGWIEPTELSTMYAGLSTRGSGTEWQVFPLWMAAALEMWIGEGLPDPDRIEG